MKRVEISPLGVLRRYAEGREPLSVEAGRTVYQLLEELGIPSDLVAVVMVNGRQELKSYPLQEGDQVKLVPLIGGGAWRKMLAIDYWRLV
jgi:sulfur carrier protein ThiS